MDQPCRSAGEIANVSFETTSDDLRYPVKQTGKFESQTGVEDHGDHDSRALDAGFTVANGRIHADALFPTLHDSILGPPTASWLPVRTIIFQVPLTELHCREHSSEIARAGRAC